jgi:hypothetical protein
MHQSLPLAAAAAAAAVALTRMRLGPAKLHKCRKSLQHLTQPFAYAAIYRQ